MEHFLVQGDKRRPAFWPGGQSWHVWTPDVLTGSDDSFQWYRLGFKEPLVGLRVKTMGPSAKFMGLTSQV